MTSIFSLRRQKDEPYLTQVFSYILSSHPDFCISFLRDCLDFQDIGDKLEVFAENSTDMGQADICIKTKGYSIAIENKINADFTPEQLKRYKTKFDKVYLIFRQLHDPEQAEYADKSLTWYEIYSFTREYLEKKKVKGIEKFLLLNFKKYLEEIKMSIEKVSPEIIKGAQSVINLSNQISEGLRRLKEKGKIIRYGSSGTSSTGFYFGFDVNFNKDKKIYIYYYLNPLLVVVAFRDLTEKYKNFETVLEKHPELPYWDEYWKYLVSFYPGQKEFLNRNTDRQIDFIMNIISTAVDQYLNSDIQKRTDVK